MIGLYGLGPEKESKLYAIKFSLIGIKFLRGYKNNSNHNNNDNNEFLNYNY